LRLANNMQWLVCAKQGTAQQSSLVAALPRFLQIQAALPREQLNMGFLAFTLDFLIGCRHRPISRVFTIRGRSYQVCCDCGATREYSLETMSWGRFTFRPKTHKAIKNGRRTAQSRPVEAHYKPLL